MKKWLVFIFILLTIGAIGIYAGYRFFYNKPHPDYAGAEAVYRLSAQEIYQAYLRNPDAAGRQYNGKVIAVQGPVTRVEQADTLVIVVFTLSTGDFGEEGVRCTMLNVSADDARKLKPDGVVTLKGVCNGFTGSDVIIEKCLIIQ